MRSARKNTRARLMLSAAGVALALSANAALAQDIEFNIAPQSLSTALYEFGSKSSRQVMFTPEITASKTTAGVSGATSELAALDQLLAGTGLTYRVNGGTLIITEGGSAPQSESAAGDGADGTVDALIVTAQKREEDIQDVPIAISAFSQETLERSQVAGGPDLMTQVPNMTFTKTNFSSYSIQLRGIGTQAISATTDPAVAVAFNNTPFIRNRFFEQEFYDLARVEVLRGPQGTLYGRNATAGVVNVISAKPVLGHEAKLSADVANYNSTRIEGMLNIPLVEDAVALRLAGAWTKREGYVTNEITGNPIDGRDLWSTRMSLSVAPTDDVRLDLIWEHFEEDDDRLRSGKQLCKKDLRSHIGGVPLPGFSGDAVGTKAVAATFSQGCAPSSLYADESFQTPNGYSLPYYQALTGLGLNTVPGLDPYLSTTQSRDLRVIESTWDPEYRAKSDLIEVQFSAGIGEGLTVASETAYSTDTLWSLQDFNRFNTAPGIFGGGAARENVLNDGVFCDPQLGCSNRLVAVDLSTAKSRQFSQELRLSSDYDGPFNFSLGANYIRYDTEDKYYVFINTLTLTAADANFTDGVKPRWEPGVSDNHECRSALPGDPRDVQDVAGCIYIDPNPIGSLNDLGHNYFLSKNPYKLISYAAFGELYYELAETLRLTGGLRWTVDKKEAPQIPSWLLASRSVGYPVAEVVEQEWREPTGRIAIDWKPGLAFTDETLVYASYAHGYKAGGANPPPTAIIIYSGLEYGDALAEDSATHPKKFEAEYVNAFEIGVKNTILDGQATLNVNAFYYDYDGYQVSQIVNRSAVNQNFDAEVWGVEMELDWRPLDNLRLGFKGGYENTAVADGEQAIDLMDRTAGHSDWVVARPFATVPSNCILPVWLVTYGGEVSVDGTGPSQFALPHLGPCVMAYSLGLDPMTEMPYVEDPTTGFWWTDGLPEKWTDYPGFNPETAPNNGEGFFKDLSGNELPNAPHFTATITADYTLPLPNDWLATLHTDLYYQSEAWTRIFNMEGYDKLKAYTNVNLAAIFSNDAAGWRVMAYVKNVFDRDSITGAFLNSDDTGLTTNVFLTEPRLYGLRVTKEWTGGSLFGSLGQGREGPYPFTLELGGQVQRHDAPYETIAPNFGEVFPSGLDLSGGQNEPLDWGDGREVKLLYRPAQGRLSLAAGFRTGQANGFRSSLDTEFGDSGCLAEAILCEIEPSLFLEKANYANATVSEGSEFKLADFSVGVDVGLGALSESKVTAGVRYAEFGSLTQARVNGTPDWQIPDELALVKYSQHHRYEASIAADRETTAIGPVVSWEASKTLVGAPDMGEIRLDWAASTGVLFGKQKTSILGEEIAQYYDDKYSNEFQAPVYTTPTPVRRVRSRSATVPLVGAAFGLSYELQRMTLAAGYRWERYFDAIDGGFAEEKDEDRTIDGPYFKLSVGFGG